MCVEPKNLFRVVIGGGQLDSIGRNLAKLEDV